MATRLELTLFWYRPHHFYCANQVVLMLTRWYLQEKSRGLYQSKVTSSLACIPGVHFSKDPKTSRPRKLSHKAPKMTFRCFSKHPKNFEPKKYVIFSRELHRYSLPPEKRFRVCFSCTCLIKWRAPTYFLGQNKRPRSCIKRDRVEEGRENNVVRKYGFY